MARCLAECVDGIGFRRLPRGKLDYQFYVEGICALIKCCLLSDLPNYTFVAANELYDPASLSVQLKPNAVGHLIS
ncbi:hypothetical protein Y032_0643g1050 [Ancylostoma ceylanicum]|uniref:Uncharacterized protein n=1 Tax=Ancylostoma ceylanicum TaxID=53326 RepID=A0A016WIR3_9BILA|nr:hypothetical protein Y032_0643g1050 [Ancylostoma ceylanicum]